MEEELKEDLLAAEIPLQLVPMTVILMVAKLEWSLDSMKLDLVLAMLME